jgi:phosphatidylglycerol:prolipoprotein diacylglycerol transferase
MSGNKLAKKAKGDRFSAVRKWMGHEPYWYIILLFLIIFSILYINHLITGSTPSRSAITINIFDLEVFWYGIIIILGVALGTFVAAHLAMERAKWVFNSHVPKKLQIQPVSVLALPAEIQKIFDKHKVERLGDVLLQWGLHPERLGLNRAGIREVQKKLETIPGVEPEWLVDAPWRVWNPDYAWNGVVACLVLAIIGARLYHVFTPSPSMADLEIRSFLDYFRRPLELINVRNGGLGIYGGIVGGALGLLWYTRRNHLPTIAWADLGVVGVALGQFVGRWGNFINQELYGRPTTLPWAVHIDPAYRLPGYETFETFHPAFLYESIWNFLSFLVLVYVIRHYYKKLQAGDLMALYLVQYAVGRILLEFVRLDSRTVALGSVSIPVATVVSLAVGLPMALLLIRRHVLGRN